MEFVYNLTQAGIAQLVEQWIENPRVSSSNLDPGISKKKLSIKLNYNNTSTTKTSKNNFILYFYISKDYI